MDRPGTLTMTFKPEDGSAAQEYEIYKYKGEGRGVMGAGVRGLQVQGCGAG